MINIFRYSTGIEFAGIIYFPMIPGGRDSVVTSPVYMFKELRSENALEAVVGIGNSDTNEAQERQFVNIHPKPAVYHGALFSDCSGTLELAQGILRMALENRPVAPETQHIPYDEGQRSRRTGGLPETRDGGAKELKERMRKAMEEEVKELEEQKKRAEEAMDRLRKQVTETQREEERMRQEMHKVEKRCQELGEQKGRAQEETDDLRKHIAEIQSEFEEDKRRRSGESSDMYDRSPCSLLSHSRVFLTVPPAHPINL